MPERAHVTSVEALEFFRSSLLVYVSKARPTLDEVSGEVVRMRSWLEDEQRMHWENEMRRRRRDFDEAQQALFSSKLSTFRETSAAEQMAVHRTKRALEAAEAKLKVVKQWDRVFDNRVGPLVKQMEKLQTVLAHDMVQAVAFLTQVIQTLEAYARIAPPAATGGPRGGGDSTQREGEP
jgi:hypothetical protein